MIYPTTGFVEGPLCCHNIVVDDSRQLHLDEMKVFSKLILGDFPCIFGPFSDTRWQLCFQCIPDKPFHEMEDVLGILHAAMLLLHAIELGPMPEPVFVVQRETFPVRLSLFEVASLLGVALESLIENTLYFGVIFLLARTPLVKISGNGPPRA